MKNAFIQPVVAGLTAPAPDHSEPQYGSQPVPALISTPENVEQTQFAPKYVPGPAVVPEP